MKGERKQNNNNENLHRSPQHYLAPALQCRVRPCAWFRVGNRYSENAGSHVLPPGVVELRCKIALSKHVNFETKLFLDAVFTSLEQLREGALWGCDMHDVRR
jgi:hypothetical protein